MNRTNNNKYLQLGHCGTSGNRSLRISLATMDNVNDDRVFAAEKIIQRRVKKVGAVNGLLDM